VKTAQPCRHCGGAEFYTAVVDAGGDAFSLLPVGILHGPRYENTICGQCGHTEWFVSKEQLYLVREKLKLKKV
jgi:predicted nucleic-acid-binding Zn-ribbon protein